MKHIKPIFASILGALALLGGAVTMTTAFSAHTAQAQSYSPKSIVDNAIANGIVGETASGYLALTSGTASADILNAMNEINAGRKSVYTQLARQQNVQIEVVAALTGEKQIAKAAPGTKVMTKEGRWITVR